MATNIITKRKYPIHTKSIVISARIPVSLLNKLNYICNETGRSKSDIIGQLIDNFDTDLIKFNSEE